MWCPSPQVSLNDIVLKSLARALSLVPEANVYWDGKSNEALPFASIDISVAVATERGLITPIVKGADKKSLAQISKDVKDLAARAVSAELCLCFYLPSSSSPDPPALPLQREGKLKPEEFIGGSFTVSNLGMMGVRQFAAILNPPQSGILAIGTSQQRAVMSPSDSSLSVESYMEVTLSADGRVYDGNLASKILQAFVEGIQGPSRLVI